MKTSDYFASITPSVPDRHADRQTQTSLVNMLPSIIASLTNEHYGECSIPSTDQRASLAAQLVDYLKVMKDKQLDVSLETHSLVTGGKTTEKKIVNFQRKNKGPEGLHCTSSFLRLGCQGIC
jgi:hypothetical protein